MNSKMLIDKKDYKYFPYNYRLIEIVKREETIKEQQTVEIKKTQTNNFKQFFYKPISRVQ